jgi:hypothetical protein
VLLPGGPSLLTAITDYLRQHERYAIFAPYIQASVLERIFEQSSPGKCGLVLTSWKPQDVACGVSDIDVYPLCRDHGTRLLVNNRLHLKLYADASLRSGLLATANVSKRGLGAVANYSYEAANLIPDLGIEGRVYLDGIIEESAVVDQDLYEKVRDQSEQLPPQQDYPNEFKVSERPTSRSGFLYTHLPMCDSVPDLLRILADPTAAGDAERRSAEHDRRLYGLAGTESDEGTLRRDLTRAFLGSPPITGLLSYNGDGRRFGDLTAWLHDHVVDVPAPRRFDIKAALQRIYRFVADLAPERYVIEQRGARTKTLARR